MALGVLEQFVVCHNNFYVTMKSNIQLLFSRFNHNHILLNIVAVMEYEFVGSKFKE